MGAGRNTKRTRRIPASRCLPKYQLCISDICLSFLEVCTSWWYTSQTPPSSHQGTLLCSCQSLDPESMYLLNQNHKVWRPSDIIGYSLLWYLDEWYVYRAYVWGHCIHQSKHARSRLQRVSHCISPRDPIVFLHYRAHWQYWYNY